MNTVEFFDVFGQIFFHGNRQDFEYMGGDWASWEARELGEGGILVTVYDDDENKREFWFNYREISD